MDILISIAKVLFISVAILNLIPLLIWMERKGSAYIQDRRGPNRASIYGIRLGGFIHNIADVFKLLFKEDIVPNKAHRAIYLLAPMIVLGVAITVVAVVPFCSPIKIGNYILTLQIADLNIGILYILAISSLSVYGVLLAGWSSSNTYSLYGGIRASAQMISYEVAMGLALVAVIVYMGTVRLDEIVTLQGVNVLDWNFVRQPLACIIFLTCLFAETNRNPFDLPEGESEIVAGYHLEYSSMKFAMFFMAEYAHIVAGSLIFVSLFLGGWQIPFISTSFLHGVIPVFPEIVTALIQIAFLFAKTLLCCWLFIWVRWTLPRFRYDQLMRLGWTIMVPLALLNIIVTAFVVAR